MTNLTTIGQTDKLTDWLIDELIDISTNAVTKTNLWLPQLKEMFLDFPSLKIVLYAGERNFSHL